MIFSFLWHINKSGCCGNPEAEAAVYKAAQKTSSNVFINSNSDLPGDEQMIGNTYRNVTCSDCLLSKVSPVSYTTIISVCFLFSCILFLSHLNSFI